MVLVKIIFMICSAESCSIFLSSSNMTKILVSADFANISVTELSCLLFTSQLYIFATFYALAVLSINVFKQRHCFFYG